LIGLFFSGIVFSPSFLFAQASLDTPLPGSFVSGIGYVRGWKCTAGTLTYTIDNGPPAPLSYGGSRGDTQSACGDTNNGFVTQQNWNLLSNGQHTIRVFDNGQQFAQATFTVTTVGAEFLTGASASALALIAGKQVELTWQQEQQNFVLTQATDQSALDTLIGQWLFGYTVLLTFGATYTLDHIDTSTGKPLLLGTDQFGGGVVAAKASDFVSVFPFTFGLLDPGATVCRFFIFNLDTANAVSGAYIQYDANATGCTTNTTGIVYVMAGARLSVLAAALMAMQAQQEAIEKEQNSQIQAAEVVGEATFIGAATEMMQKMQGY
jgi:hypothetical protein